MRAYILAAAAAALFVVPTYAFSQEIHIGPGGVSVGPGYHSDRYYDRHEGGPGPGYHGHRLYNRYEGSRCRDLRAACMHKDELGEQGMGNCRRYRANCG